MGDFGKLDFAVAFNPMTAFPLDGRCYFNSLALAEAAAATAKEVGSTESRYYYGMKLLVDDGVKPRWYRIQRDNTLREEMTFVALTQTEYNALVEAGTVEGDVPYLIIEGE